MNDAENARKSFFNINSGNQPKQYYATYDQDNGGFGEAIDGSLILMSNTFVRKVEQAIKGIDLAAYGISFDRNAADLEGDDLIHELAARIVREISVAAYKGTDN